MAFENQNDHHWQCQQSLPHKIFVPSSIFGSQDLARQQGFQSFNEKFVFFIIIFYSYIIFNGLSIFLLNLMPLPLRGAGCAGGEEKSNLFPVVAPCSRATDRLNLLHPFRMRTSGLTPVEPKQKTYT